MMFADRLTRIHDRLEGALVVSLVGKDGIIALLRSRGYRVENL